MGDRTALRDINLTGSPTQPIPYWTTPDPTQQSAWFAAADRLAQGLAQRARLRAFVEPHRSLVGFCAGDTKRANRLAAHLAAEGVEAVVLCGHGDGRGKADDVCLPCRPDAPAAETNRIGQAVGASLQRDQPPATVMGRAGRFLQAIGRRVLGGVESPDTLVTGDTLMLPLPVLLFPEGYSEATRETLHEGVGRLVGVDALQADGAAKDEWTDLDRWIQASKATQVVILIAQIAPSPALTIHADLLRQALCRRLPALDVRIAAPLGSHPGLVQAIEDRVALAGNQVPVRDTAIIIAAPDGEPEANAEMARLTRLVYEQRRNGMVELAFFSVSTPTLAEMVWRVDRLGARSAVIVPAVIEGEIALPATDCSIELHLARPLAGHIGIATALVDRYHEAVSGRPSMTVGLGATMHSHGGPGHSHDILPPRYRGNTAVSAAPMSAADVVYDDDGRVAWNEIWGGFCELALAGGPPHRGYLLEPVTADDVAADREGYAAVVSELVRGLTMVTDCEVVVSATPGWIGLRCESEEMAIWLLRAITVENVAVRREGTVLYLPAGPKFRLEHEIKNVITVVAKTNHYWKEHIAAR